MLNAEVRGFVAVALVAVAIVVLIIRLDYDDEPAASPATTTTAVGTTTTGVPTPQDAAGELCDLARELRRTIIDRFTAPTLQPVEDLLANFYLAAAALPLGPVTAEYSAAADFYRRYTEVAGEYGFDEERIVVEAPEDEYLVWRSLVSGEALGVEATNTQVAFLCDVVMPDPPVIELDDLEDLEREFRREREEFQEELEDRAEGGNGSEG